MGEMVAADVVDLRDPSDSEPFVAPVLEVIRRRTGEILGLDDLDRDLGLPARRRFELAGDLAEALDLPGVDDDAVNSCVIETLAMSRTPRALAINVAAVHVGPSPRQLRAVTGSIGTVRRTA